MSTPTKDSHSNQNNSLQTPAGSFVVINIVSDTLQECLQDVYSFIIVSSPFQCKCFGCVHCKSKHPSCLDTLIPCHQQKQVCQFIQKYIKDFMSDWAIKQGTFLLPTQLSLGLGTTFHLVDNLQGEA